MVWKLYGPLLEWIWIFMHTMGTFWQIHGFWLNNSIEDISIQWIFKFQCLYNSLN